jgi:hypothetical protein
LATTLVAFGLCCSCVLLGQVVGGESWAETKLTASDGRSLDFFGRAVAVSADRVVVAAPEDDGPGADRGAVYVYEWDGAQWAETKLTASDGAPFDEFGISVAVSGDRIVVGAEWDDDHATDSGSVYIYEWDGAEWVETKLTASDAEAEDRFGTAVAISGDRLVVGALDDDNGSAAGAIYVYDWDGVEWLETKLTASDGSTADHLGLGVAVDGDRVVAGARRDDDHGASSGSVYIFDWDGIEWLETKLTASDGAFNDWYGTSMAVDGDRVVVGSWFDDTDNGTDSGSIYVYDWNGAEWVETQLIAGDGIPFADYGRSVAMSGDRIVVGAYEDDASGLATGSAYVYEWDGANWLEIKLAATDGASFDDYGIAVATAGDRIVVGSRFDDDNGDDSGSAYVYERGGFTLAASGACPGEVTLTVTTPGPEQDVQLFLGREAGSSSIAGGPCAGTELDIRQTRSWRSLTTDENGGATLVRDLSAPWCERWVQAVDRTCSTSNAVQLP